MSALRTPVLNVCREALKRGPLILDGQAWRFGRRAFNFETVRALIDAGEAIRIGNHIVRWSPIE